MRMVCGVCCVFAFLGFPFVFIYLLFGYVALYELLMFVFIWFGLTLFCCFGLGLFRTLRCLR